MSEKDIEMANRYGIQYGLLSAWGAESLAAVEYLEALEWAMEYTIECLSEHSDEDDPERLQVLAALEKIQARRLEENALKEKTNDGFRQDDEKTDRRFLAWAYSQDDDARSVMIARHLEDGSPQTRLPRSALPSLVSCWNVLEIVCDCKPAHLRSLLRMVRRYNAKFPEDIKNNTYSKWSRARCTVALMQDWVDGLWHRDHRMKLADYWGWKGHASNQGR